MTCIRMQAIAVSKGCPVPSLQALLQSGADVEDAGPMGSALQIAVRNSDVDAVKCLLNYGADAAGINTGSSSGPAFVC